ncbi:hypothetical protein Ddye_017846, partial [Dipteronia dyeriana]
LHAKNVNYKNSLRRLGLVLHEVRLRLALSSGNIHSIYESHSEGRESTDLEGKRNLLLSWLPLKDKIKLKSPR